MGGQDEGLALFGELAQPGPDPVGDAKAIASETDDPATWTWTAADKLFLKLLDECHRRKIRVVIDGVFNHTSSDSPYFDRYGRYAADGTLNDEDGGISRAAPFRAPSSRSPARVDQNC